MLIKKGTNRLVLIGGEGYVYKLPLCERFRATKATVTV